MTIEQLFGRKVVAFIFLIAGLGTLFTGVRDWPHPFAAVLFAVTGLLFADYFTWLPAKRAAIGQVVEMNYEYDTAISGRRRRHPSTSAQDKVSRRGVMISRRLPRIARSRAARGRLPSCH
jgi:hypothetical protein